MDWPGGTEDGGEVEEKGEEMGEGSCFEDYCYFLDFCLWGSRKLQWFRELEFLCLEELVHQDLVGLRFWFWFWRCNLSIYDIDFVL